MFAKKQNVSRAIGVVGLLCLTLSSSWAGNAPTLDQALAKRPQSTEAPSTAGISAARYAVLREAALEYGMQAGLAFGHQQIRQQLERRGAEMDALYPFGSLMLEGNVIPPIIKELRDVYDQTSGTTLRLADREVVMKSPPRFSYSAPNWRDYVHHNFVFDEKVVANITPQSPEENELWDKSVREGYALGYEDSFKILDNDLSAADADVIGMKLYHQLLVDGKVTKVFVSVAHYGVTGDKNKALKEGESYLQIAAVPEFVMNPGQWNIDRSSAIQERLKVLVDPEAGGKMLESLGVAKERDESPSDKKKVKPAMKGGR